jgi:hypothetical protein
MGLIDDIKSWLNGEETDHPYVTMLLKVLGGVIVLSLIFGFVIFLVYRKVAFGDQPIFRGAMWGLGKGSMLDFMLLFFGIFLFIGVVKLFPSFDITANLP